MNLNLAYYGVFLSTTAFTDIHVFTVTCGSTLC